MDIFDVLNMIGGLCLFLFGMNIMGEALERQAGSSLSNVLGKLTSNRLLAFLTGLGVTAVIQSSSATTVMVVGFVNSAVMTLKQAIGVIMGANVGTTVTSWILSLTAIEGDSLFIQLLKPTSFTPILALIGVVLYVFLKDHKKKNTGMILLGFATLMFGMDTMSAAVEGLKDVPAFQQLFLTFENPILGMLAGAILTAIIQSSSASVGILQALAVTGAVSYSSAIPIIMGQNIGTCITAMLSSIGTNKNAKRTGLVHLCFNVIGTVVWLTVFAIVQKVFAPAIFAEDATKFGIAICHSIFNIACTVLMLPLGGMLEKLVCKLVPDGKAPEKVTELDERLLVTPSVALDRCRVVAGQMAQCARDALLGGVQALEGTTKALADQVRKSEEDTDEYEDMLGSYLVKLSALQLSDKDTAEAAMLLKAIGDLERISDHGVNLLESAEELKRKGIALSENAQKELKVLVGAVTEIIDIAFQAFSAGDASLARQVEPLEQVIDELKEAMRTRHILRLQQGTCSIETGFIWSDLLTNLERVSDHCSNLAGCILDLDCHDMSMHHNLREVKAESERYDVMYRNYTAKYRLS